MYQPRAMVWIIVLVVVLFGGYLSWQNFAPQSSITITGTSTVTAAPDQFTFYPSYSKQAAVSTDAISQVSAIGNDVVVKLKDLGVAKGDITTSVSSYPNYAPSPVKGGQTDGFTATYSVTAKAKDQDAATKISAYLATTPVEGGSVTPSAGFSTDKKAALERDARAKALTDAADKANQTVKTLGVHLLGIKSVSESSPFTYPTSYPYALSSGAADTSTAATPTLETGNQDYTFTVTVEYRIR